MNNDKFIMSITVNLNMLDDIQKDAGYSIYDGIVKMMGSEPEIKLDSEQGTVTFVINLPEEDL